MVLWQLALMVLAASPGQPMEDPWLSAHAWEAVDPAASPLAGSPVADLLIYRRHLHAEVLELLKDEQLSDIAKVECFRILSILRVCDRVSLAPTVALANWLPGLDTPTHAARISPMHQDMALVCPGHYALQCIDLPAVLPLLESFWDADDRELVARLLAIAAGGAAPAMAAEAWGPIGDPQVNEAVAKYYGDWPNPGSIQYSLVIAGAERTDEPLRKVLSTEDFPTRLSVGQDLIRRQRAAEQWLGEALAAGNPHSAGWDARKGNPKGVPHDPDYSYIAESWPAGQAPPKSLTPEERTACILAVGEIRSRNMTVLQVLMENLTFVPDSWPYRVGPAGLVLARAGMPAIYSMLGLSRDTPEVRRAKLDVIGLMLGRFAAEPFKGIKAKNFRPWPGIDDDIAYLQREYAGAKGIYEYIPDEPPKAP